MKSSLKFKMIGLLSGALVISIAIISTITILNFVSNTEEIVYSKASDLVDSTAKQIELKLGEMKSLVGVIGTTNQMIDYFKGENVSDEEIFSYLQSTLKRNEESMESLVLVDKDKQAFMTASDITIDLDLTSREYFKEADLGKIAISDAIVSGATGNVVIAVVSPIQENDEILGYVIATVLFSEIQDIVYSVKVFETGYAYMFAMDGLTLAHPDPANEFELNLGEIGINELNIMLDNVNNNQRGEGFYTFKGVYKYVNYERVERWGVAVTANYSDYMKTTLKTRNTVIIIAVVLTLITMAIAYIFTARQLISPIKQISSAMNEAGHGDLTVVTQVRSKDEVGQISESFNAMIQEQKTVIGSVHKSSNTLKLATDEISLSATQVSESSTLIANNASELAGISVEQNDSISDASQVILQLSSLIELAKVKAVSASENVEASLEVASVGRDNVNLTMDAIHEIKETTIETNQSLSQVADLSTQIKGVVETINSIASQTNLLALNASIEAARAGEHGKGFSVVAEEVRKLAEQTASEANQISSVISKMTTKIEDVVVAMEKSQGTVDTGVVRAKNTDESFVNILNTFKTVTEDISKIEEITTDEVVSSEEIIKIISSVGELSDKNSASAQDIAAAVEEQTALLENISASSEEINSMAEELNDMVDTFVVE